MRRMSLARTFETAFAMAVEKRGGLKRVTGQLETAGDELEKEC